MKRSSWLMEFGHPWKEKEEKKNKVVELDDIKFGMCPLCGGDLYYISSEYIYACFDCEYDDDFVVY